MSMTPIQQRKASLNAIRTSFKMIHVFKIHSNTNQDSVAQPQLNSSSHQSINQQVKTSQKSSETDIFQAIHDEVLHQVCFFQSYALLQKIGQGCNASVYKCINKNTKQIFAVKKVKIEEDHLLEFKQNFIKINQLKHHSLCSYKALYFGNKQRLAFLVMHYYPFPNLSQCVISSEEQLKSIIKQLVTVIKYLHKLNICHRDIKPENILYNQQNGKVKIIDFGISKKFFQGRTRRDMLTIIGTNFYIAPEIYLGGGYNQKVDLWALGVTIFKLITGHTPFQSEYHSQTISNILKGQVDFSDKVWQKYTHFFAKDFVRQLLQQRSKRMTINQCQNHLWFQSQKKKKKKKKSIKTKRVLSFNIQIGQDFRVETKKHNQSMPKQQGAFIQAKINSPRLNRYPISISELEERNNDFEDYFNEEQAIYQKKHRKSF